MSAAEKNERQIKPVDIENDDQSQTNWINDDINIDCRLRDLWLRFAYNLLVSIEKNNALNKTRKKNENFSRIAFISFIRRFAHLLLLFSSSSWSAIAPSSKWLIKTMNESEMWTQNEFLFKAADFFSLLFIIYLVILLNYSVFFACFDFFFFLF